MILVIITADHLFVTGLMLWVFIRYNKKRNPTPRLSPTTRRGSCMDDCADCYSCADRRVFLADSVQAAGNSRGRYHHQGRPATSGTGRMSMSMTGLALTATCSAPRRAVEPQNAVCRRAEAAAFGAIPVGTDTSWCPVGKTIVVQVTGADVIHAWTIPAFGVKQDAVPGRLAELWFNADKEGVYFGQCSELCGKDHAYMPITVKVVVQRPIRRVARQGQRRICWHAAGGAIASK